MVYLTPSLHKVDYGYLNCNDTILGADHSVMWLDVPVVFLHLQVPHHLAKGQRLKTNSPRVQDNYLDWYKTVCDKYDLIAWARALWASVQDGKLLTVEQMMEFETIDALCTKGMNEAEKHCRKIKMGAIEWLPELALA